MSSVIPFTREFDGTFMTPDEIARKARELGWPGLRIDSENFMGSGKITVTRMSKREVENFGS